MDTAKNIHRLASEIESDLRLTGNHIVSASGTDFAPAVVEYLQHRFPQARISLRGEQVHFIIQCVEPSALS